MLFSRGRPFQARSGLTRASISQHDLSILVSLPRCFERLFELLERLELHEGLELLLLDQILDRREAGQGETTCETGVHWE